MSQKFSNNQIVSRAREILSDTYAEAYRWSNLMLLRYLYEGIQKLHMIRPESRYDGVSLVEYSEPDLTTSGDESSDNLKAEEILSMDFPLNPRWKDAIVHYICAMAFQIDNSDTMNAQRYSEHIGMFTTWGKM